MNRSLVVLIMISLLPVLSGGRPCAAADEGEPVVAIQERIYDKNHEIGLPLGYISDDDFYEVYPVGISYTYHFNENWSWEVARGLFFLNQEKELKGKLENQFGVTPSEFSEPKYMIHSSLVLRPFYGKEAVWNKGIINKESYFLIGGGVVNYERQYSYGDPATENALSINVGYGSRYFINQRLCLNLEIRDLITFKEEKTENNIFVGITFGYRFDLFPRKTEKDQTIQKLKTYLQKQDIK